MKPIKGLMISAAFAAAAFTASGAAFAQATPGFTAATSRVNWDKPIEPFKIIDNVYYVGTAGLASYLFVTPEGSILLDGAMPETAPVIEANIKKLGFKLADVKYLLNSHAHADHSGGLAKLKADTGAQMLASEGDRPALEGGYNSGSPDTKPTTAAVKVDTVVNDGYKLTLGGRTLTAHLTPGHTRGCTSWGFEAKDGGKTYQGLVFCSATVVAELVNPPRYEGVVQDYRSTFEKTAKMKVDIFLAPHAEFFDLAGKLAKQAPGAANPFVDPAEFGLFMAAAKTDFDAALKKQEDKAKAAHATAH